MDNLTGKQKGKPRLDYYIGRLVTDVTETEDGYDIVLDGNVRISNTDGRRATPSGIIGLSFMRAILSTEETRLQFGRIRPEREPMDQTEVVLTPHRYRISDERYEGGPHYPQGNQDSELDTPEMPVGRDADGPENPEDEQ